MNRATSALLVAAVVSLPVGWILVFASGYGGNSTSGSEIVWRSGGLMIYGGLAMLLLAAVIHVIRLTSAAARRRRVAGHFDPSPRQSLRRH
jgi:hypothetical protein